MRVLLTGATGFVGGYACSEILAKGWELRVLVRKNSGNLEVLPEKAEKCFGGLKFESESETAKILRGVDAVIHNGYCHDIDALVDPLGFFENNVRGTFRFIEFSRRQGVKQFVFVSSKAAYGSAPAGKITDEAAVCRPDGEYGAYKAAIDAYVYAMAKELNFNICSLRLGWVYGIFRDYRRMAFYKETKQITENSRAVKLEGSFDLVNALDAAKAMVFVLGNKNVKGEIYNVLNDKSTTALSMGKYVKELCGSKSRLTGATASSSRTGNEKFRKLGFKFSNTEGVREYLSRLVGLAGQH